MYPNLGLFALAELLWLLNACAVSAITDLTEASTAAPKPPIFPDIFSLKYTFSMPHFYLTQPNGLSYSVSVWYDGPNNLRRVEAYDGEDSCVSVEGVDYTVIPRINTLQCDVYGEKGRKVYPPLPDLTLWEYGGAADFDGRQALIWQRQIKEYDRVSQYAFYVTPDAVPLRLYMIGVNYLTNAHFDEYLYDFTHFQPGLPNNASNLFAIPVVCQQQAAALAEAEVAADRTVPAPARRQHPVALQLGALLPDIQAYDHNRAYNIWSRAHGRVHEDADEYDSRMERFRSIVDRIQAHNARSDRSYSMRLNHWADWHEHEFIEAMMPARGIRKPQQQRGEKPDEAAAGVVEAGGLRDGEGEDSDVLMSQLPGSYRPLDRLVATLTRSQLPDVVDWRGTGADPGVKDQGMCGSCYAFAATGAMDGRWFVATGQRRSFSEQQIVDCAWDYGPNGCFGGYYQPVFNYIAESGGIALEQDYSYRSEVGFCRSANHSLVGRFSGYWAVESRNDLALMEAVWKYGPVAVSVDAAPDTFRFYWEGVYDEPTCSHKMRDLDHTVTLYGYGTTPDGKDYWLVRNSWAKFFGDDGYIRIIRGRRDCGIATDPAVPVVPEHLVNQEAQEAARKSAASWNRGNQQQQSAEVA
ncbi:hypothetical protein VaNZ11_016680 [Volvox africanus]|uniref:Uncharacterized protein n=1 Tax=Volvox africanus TaxID=51714 RepID=A0ABQ5SNV3_9CHLO|nr:hypothetical protein VaNZ11_016680 [Volvox africanus]